MPVSKLGALQWCCSRGPLGVEGKQEVVPVPVGPGPSAVLGKGRNKAGDLLQEKKKKRPLSTKGFLVYLREGQNVSGVRRMGNLGCLLQHCDFVHWEVNKNRKVNLSCRLIPRSGAAYVRTYANWSDFHPSRIKLGSTSQCVSPSSDRIQGSPSLTR